MGRFRFLAATLAFGAVVFAAGPAFSAAAEVSAAARSALAGSGRVQYAQAAAPQATTPQTAPAQPADASQTPDAIGSITTLQGSATVTRGTATNPLKVDDEIFKNDILQTGRDATLGVTFDDETSFNLSPNTRLVVDNFVYEDGGKKNAALFNVARGTAAFVASKVAKTGDMKIATPSATMGIRGTTGVVEVPENAGTAPTAEQARIKLYADSDGRVGRIEVFNPTGARLGILSNAASAFAIRPGGGALRFAAVPFQISAQEAARDRGVVQRLFAAHTLGQQKVLQRFQQRLQRNPQLRQNLQRQPFQQQRGPLQQQQLQRPFQQQQLQRPLQQQPQLQRPLQQPQLQRPIPQQQLQQQPGQQLQRPGLLQRLPGFQRPAQQPQKPAQQQPLRRVPPDQQNRQNP